MRIILLFFLLLFFFLGQAQNQKGIAFQAIARNGSGIVLHNKKMQVRISLLTDTLDNKSIVYQELSSITTNPLGLFSIMIGVTEKSKINTIGVFEKINWPNTIYFIRVEIDPENRLQFIRIGQQQLQYAAYAFSADHVLADNIEGLLSIQQGGTGVTNLPALKLNMQMDKVNNIPDSAKVLSKASIQALSNKLDKKDTSSLSSRINQKMNKGDLSAQDFASSLGFVPFQMDNGSFFDTSRQGALINTATPVKWRDTSSNAFLSISTNSSMEPTRITVVKKGVYFLQYAIQVSNTQVANDEISTWIRRNGSAFPNSLRQNLTGPIGAKNIFSGQALIPVDEEDYIELFFSVRHIQTQLLKTNTLTNPSRPATPSAQIILFRIQ